MSLAQVALLTHAGFGEALLDVVEHIYGDRPAAVFALSPAGDDLTSLRARLQELIDAAGSERPLLILCDIRGASPANALPETWANPWVRVVYGLNLPMLLRALSRREHWEGLPELVAEGGRAAIQGHP
ncbi:hypothetical protein [Acidithiobacillus sp. AMEEHan]|uniref:PTS sugar transporter subunit IIA n=1 Tax=Acidithiobacillus sp. AMEEHan TaxID=2994951 RepID=UPI0027E4121F|nr:hypothetical protein [Acidithiobacillus sp. AMEEHan]